MGIRRRQDREHRAGLPPFDPNEYQIEQFLHRMAGDIKSLIRCIRKALLVHHDIECRAEISHSVTMPPTCRLGLLSAFMRRDRSASFVVSAIQKDGVRLYSFETDDGFLEDVPLQGNATGRATPSRPHRPRVAGQG